MDDLIEALTIFKKYGNPSSPTICTHDKLYITGEIRPDDVSSEDRERLEELGFLVDSGLDQFYSYRFGSA